MTKNHMTNAAEELAISRFVRPLMGWTLSSASLGYATMRAGAVAHIEGPPEVGGSKSLCGRELVALHGRGKVTRYCKHCLKKAKFYRSIQIEEVTFNG
jgi:hypothetical protein